MIVSVTSILKSIVMYRITRIFAGEKLDNLMSQISKKLDPLRSNYCVLAKDCVSY